MSSITLKCKKDNYDAIIPQIVSASNAGIDLATPVPFEIYKGQMIKVNLNLAVEIPEGYVGILKDRSSLASQGLHVLGGVIDSSYRGPISVVIKNMSDQRKTFERGDRVCQMLIIPYPSVEIVEVSTLTPTDRGTGGFGSTGA